MEIKFLKLNPDAITPTYGTDGAAAFDLYALNYSSGKGRVTINTGLSFEIPDGYAMIIKPRSGMAFKEHLHAFSGTIDSDYRGEVKVLLISEDPETYIKVAADERIAQAIVIPIPRVTFKEVTELSTTDRGTAGFGSTG